MRRLDALKAVYSALESRVVVTIMGAVAAELQSIGHRPNFFYLQHAMGLASSMGLGIALCRPDQQIVVLDGDGSILMNLGGLTTLARYRPRNLVHVVFDNESLLSVGGFPTATATGSDLAAIASAAPDIKVAGVEMSTGGLGHGLAVGVGMALGARIKGKSFQTYVMIGDGELHEGSNWEAAMCAAHYRLSNLTAIIDANKISQSAHVANLVGIEPLADKWRAFGWEVREIDGHNMGQIVDALDALPFNAQKPSALIAHTVKGKGVSFAEDTYVWHRTRSTTRY